MKNTETNILKQGHQNIHEESLQQGLFLGQVRTVQL